MNEPKLRFKGFKDEWENKKLKDIANIVGGGTPSTNISNYWNGNINWYSPNEIDEKPFRYKSNKKITEDGLKNSSARMHPINTILFTSRAGIGKMTIIKEPAATSQGFQSIELKKNIYPYFIYSLKNKIKHSAIRLSSGSTFLEISKRSVEKINFDLPNYNEQQKIGSFFEKLDKLIQLQSDKLEHLKITKKGYLQKIFPKKNKNIPLIRFKNFKYNWKKYKLSNYLSEPKKEKANVKSLKDIMTLKLHLKGLVQSSNRETLSLKSTKYYVRHSGQLIYGKQNFFNGSIAIIPDKFEGLATSQDVPSLKIDRINPMYLFDYISKKDFFKYAERFTNGTGSKRLHERDLFNLEIKVPNIDEQNNISNFLDLLDQQITLQQQKLDNLVQQKKAYLQKIFI